MAHSGERCKCGGYIRVRTSEQRGEHQVRYLECGSCRRDCGKEVVAAACIRRRYL